MSTIYIFGHKNPDSDSICASIGYAALKTMLGGKENYISCRIGDINEETNFILQYFDVEPPVFIENVKPQISDMEYYPVQTIPQHTPLKKAWEMIRQKGHTLLPIDDENGDFKGIVSVSDITQTYISLMDNNFLEKYQVTIRSVSDGLDASVLSGQELLEAIAGRLYVYGNISGGDGAAMKENDIMIVAGTIGNIIESMEYKANYVIVVGDLKDKDVEVLAQYANIKNKAVLNVNHDLLSVIRLISQCIPVRGIMKTDRIIYFYENEYIDEIRDLMIESRHRYFPVIDTNSRVVGTISRKQLLTHKKKKIILVDHNEMSQTVNGIEQAEILEIIDHHRLGDIQTGNPIFVRYTPVGSTSTIVANMFFENNLQPEKKIAGVLCAAIISDTLLFKSPTCTQHDVRTAKRLAEIAEVDIGKFGFEMLRTGASIIRKSPRDILMNDVKEYNLGKYRFSISQINTMDLSELDPKIDELRNLMQEKAEAGKYHAVILLVTDLMKEGSLLILEGMESDKVRMAFGISEHSQSFFLEGVVSRKKQVIPKLAISM